MTAILQIEASARHNGSLSRKLAGLFEREWGRHEPQAAFLHRDVGLKPPSFVTEEWIAAAFTRASDRGAEQERLLQVSDELIDEIEWADVIVIASPMYNYGMPAALKAWFDQVIRIGRTFSFDLERGDWPLRPIHEGKTLVVLSAKGEFGFGPGELRGEMNHLDKHIETCAHYLGATQRHFIGIEYQEFGDERHQQSVAAAERDVSALVGELAATFNSRSVYDAADSR